MGISFSLSSFWELLVSRWPELVTELFRHINMTTLALLISLAIGVPLGILITRNQTAAKIVIGIANVMQSIPSIALLSLAVCFLGIGTVPAILMVLCVCLPPHSEEYLYRHHERGPQEPGGSPGHGLTRTRCLFLVELPIAAPFIMAGIRIAAVASVGTMTIAAFAGAKGLGWFINLGLNSLNVEVTCWAPSRFPCWRCSLISSSPSWSRRSPVRACFPTSRSRICPRRSSAAGR